VDSGQFVNIGDAN